MNEDDKKNYIDFYIRGIGHSIRYKNDEKLSEFNITNQQGRLLGIIYEGINSNKVMNRKYLEEVTALKGPSVTSLLNSLEKSNFISRSSDSEDGRARNIKITAKGEKLIADMDDVFKETEGKLLSNFTKEEETEFKRLLMKAYDNVK